MSELSGRLIGAAAWAIHHEYESLFVGSLQDVTDPDDWQREARAAVVAVLRELAENAMPAIYNTDPAIWYAGELESLAGWIEAGR
jgi:hypothetical protein